MESKQLRIRCGQVKAQLTRIQTFFRTTDGPTVVEARLEKLIELWDKFEELQSSLESIQEILTEEEELQEAQSDSEAKRAAFEAMYYDVAAKAHGIIDRANKAREHRTLELNQGNNRQDERNYVRRAKPKLPEIKLPEFRGEYTKWMFFKNSFESTIRNDEDLSPVQKHQYLVGVLQGEARQVIQGFKISHENYESAWKLLKDTYDNEMIIIETHLDELLKFPNITKKNKAESIRQFIWHIQTHVKSLEALQQPVFEWETIIITLAKKKLDFTKQRDWQNIVKGKTPHNMPRLDEFIKFLTERCHMLRVLNNSKEKSAAQRQQQQKKSEKKISLASTSSICKICNGDHPVYKCDELFKTATSERFKLVREKQHCVNCLKPGHYAKNCKASFCKNCQGKHNTILHRETETSSHENKYTETSLVTICSENLSTKAIPTEVSRDEKKVGVYYTQRPASRVVLSTARVYVQDEEDNQQICRALLDPRSQSNLITEKMIRKLKLSCRSEDRDICGVSQSRTRIRKVAQVRLASMHNDFATILECLVLPSITEDLPQKRIEMNSITLPKNISLAGPIFQEPGSIDLLIGAELYWKILLGASRNRINGQPALQNTKLGWIVGGSLNDSK
ncbi:uncharacterized protein LOC112637714 [Camponotus floridanus]|uniref:uncharacterized protein LOC112637714 n=1 Tax=Camponotus floridanus TaxID=104421 RepID=UPI000DC66B32|nr:uncharacterized protein LOC112637714 [Camponotus floridanus]